MTPLLVLTNQTATLAVGTNDADPGHVRGARARQVHLHTAAVVHGVDALALRTPSLGIELRTSLRQMHRVGIAPSAWRLHTVTILARRGVVVAHQQNVGHVLDQRAAHALSGRLGRGCPEPIALRGSTALPRSSILQASPFKPHSPMPKIL